jgi:hypothetical protein
MDISSLLPLILSAANKTGNSSSSTGQTSPSQATSGFNDMLKSMIMSSMMSSTSLSGLTGGDGNTDSSSGLFGSGDSSGSLGGMSNLMGMTGSSNDMFSTLLMALENNSNSQNLSQEKLLPLMMLGMMGSSSILGSDSSSSSGLGTDIMSPVMMTLLNKLLSGGLSSMSGSTSLVNAISNTSSKTNTLAARNAYSSNLTREGIKDFHVNQFEAELQVGGDGANADCGPASLVMALRALGLLVKGETANTTDGDAVDLARLSMVDDPELDGVDAEGNRVESEHSIFTTLDDVARGANAAGANVETITANASSIQAALEKGAKVVITGTFAGKDSLPWTGDNGVDNNIAPGGAEGHIVAVTGYDPNNGMFLVQDPARTTPMMVTTQALEQFMDGNAGALAISR